MSTYDVVLQSLLETLGRLFVKGEGGMGFSVTRGPKKKKFG